MNRSLHASIFPNPKAVCVEIFALNAQCVVIFELDRSMREKLRTESLYTSKLAHPRAPCIKNFETDRSICGKFWTRGHHAFIYTTSRCIRWLSHRSAPCIEISAGVPRVQIFEPDRCTCEKFQTRSLHAWKLQYPSVLLFWPDRCMRWFSNPITPWVKIFASDCSMG